MVMKTDIIGIDSNQGSSRRFSLPVGFFYFTPFMVDEGDFERRQKPYG